MMRALFVAAILAAASVPAQAESMMNACQADIAKFCSAVEPGHGRISACLYAHEDKISDGCDRATADMGDVIDLFFSDVREVHIACGEDVQKFCSDLSIGAGRVLSCLRQNEVSAACGQAIQGIGQPDG